MSEKRKAGQPFMAATGPGRASVDVLGCSHDSIVLAGVQAQGLPFALQVAGLALLAVLVAEQASEVVAEQQGSVA